MKALVTICVFFCASSAFAQPATCVDEYNKAKSSQSVPEVLAAAVSCDLIAKGICRIFVKGDALTNANCVLAMQMGANLAVTDSKGSAKCLKAAEVSKQLPFSSQAKLAAAACHEATEDVCAGTVDQPDSSMTVQLATAHCLLKAKLGGYEAAIKFIN